MRKHRFFLPQDSFSTKFVHLPRSIQNQIRNVLRLQPGDEIDVMDGSGEIFHARLVEGENGELAAEIIGREWARGEPAAHVTLVAALTQREKFEWILQKGTEIGVSVFQPFISSRTLIQKTSQADRKEQRWKEILREAAEQSGRGCISQIKPTLSLKEVLAAVSEAREPALAAWTDTSQPDLKTALSALGGDIQHLAVITGPEGGFSPEELEWMRAAAVQPFNLGDRVLRMETAAILAPALVLYELGEMRTSE
jgi:16S rRNA (uracil1498-N3)-methyltransferase